MGYNILVVDDSQIIQEVMKKTLFMTGLEIGQVFTAKNGLEALEVIEQEWVDLVFTDIHMPKMDGVGLMEELNRKGMIKDLPVIVVSTEGNQKKKMTLIQLGVVDFIRKPVTPEAVKNSIDKAIAQ